MIGTTFFTSWLIFCFKNKRPLEHRFRKSLRCQKYKKILKRCMILKTKQSSLIQIQINNWIKYSILSLWHSKNILNNLKKDILWNSEKKMCVEAREIKVYQKFKIKVTCIKIRVLTPVIELAWLIQSINHKIGRI
jgi:hypothetical protein